MKIEKFPERIPVLPYDEVTLTVTGEDICLILDALSSLRCSLLSELGSLVLSDHFDDWYLNVSMEKLVDVQSLFQNLLVLKTKTVDP